MKRTERHKLKKNAIEEFLVKQIKKISIYSKQIGIGLIIILSFFAIYTGYTYLKKSYEKHDAKIFYTIIKNIDKKNIFKKLKNSIKQYKTTKYKTISHLKIAILLIKKGKTNEAISHLQYSLDNGKGIIKNVSAYLLGKIYEKDHKLKDAIKYYNIVISQRYNQYRAMSLLALARIYQQQNDYNKAMFFLETIRIEYPNTKFSKLASIQKAILQDKMKK